MNVRERAIISQTNIRNVTKATLEKRLREFLDSNVYATVCSRCSWAAVLYTAEDIPGQQCLILFKAFPDSSVRYCILRLFWTAVFDTVYLTPSLPQPLKFVGEKCTDAPANNSLIISDPISHLFSVLCVLMKILSHASARNKTKRQKGFRFPTVIGCFQVTSWQ